MERAGTKRGRGGRFPSLLLMSLLLSSISQTSLCCCSHSSLGFFFPDGRKNNSRHMGNRNVGIKLNGYLLPRDFFCFISVTDTKLVWDVRHGCQSELSFYCARNSACVFGRNVIKSQKEKYRTKCGSYFEFSHTGTFMRRRTGNDGEWVCQHRREK